MKVTIKRNARVPNALVTIELEDDESPDWEHPLFNAVMSIVYSDEWISILPVDSKNVVRVQLPSDAEKPSPEELRTLINEKVDKIKGEIKEATLREIRREEERLEREAWEVDEEENIPLD